MCHLKRSLLWLAAGLVSLFVTLPAGAEPVVVATRYGVHPDRTRFVVELNEPVAFTVFTLADPYRVVVELPDVAWQIPPDAGSRGAGLIAGFRYGQFQPGITRIVIDLKAPARVKQAFTAPPEADRQYRLVVDLEATTGEAFLAELRQRAPPQAAAQAPPVVIQPPPAAAQPPPRSYAFCKYRDLRPPDVGERGESSKKCRDRRLTSPDNECVLGLRLRSSRQ